MGLANQNSQLGLRPVGNTVGDAHHTGVEYGYISKTNTQDLYIGMLVKLTGDAGSLPVFSGAQSGGAAQPDPYQGLDAGNYPGVEYMAPGDGGDVYGVIVGFEYDGDLAKNGTKYLPSGTEALVRIKTDPDAIYEIAVDAQLTSADVGLNIDLTAPAPVQMFGFSGQQLAAATKGTANTLPLRLLRAKNVPTNELDVNNAIWYVRINRPERLNTTGA